LLSALAIGNWIFPCWSSSWKYAANKWWKTLYNRFWTYEQFRRLL